MTQEQHKAELVVIHRNQMDAESRLRKRLNYWKERRNELIKNSGGVNKMNEAQARNYEIINGTIEDIEYYQTCEKGFGAKYQDLYLRQCEFLKKVYTPSFRMDLIRGLVNGINDHITDHINQSIIK